MGLIKIFGIINDINLSFVLETSASHNFLSLQNVDQLNPLLHTGSVGNVQLTNGEELHGTVYIQVLVLFGETQ